MANNKIPHPKAPKDNPLEALLQQPLENLKPLSPRQVVLLAKKELQTFGDLLHFFPKRYEDRSSVSSVANATQKALLEPESIATMLCVCSEVGQFPYHNRTIKRFVFSDESGEVAFAAFDPKHRYFKKGKHYMLSGKIKFRSVQPHLNLLDFEPFEKEDFDSLHLGRIVPIYPSTVGLAQKKIREAVRHLFEAALPKDMPYNLPETYRLHYRLRSRLLDLFEVHFPNSYDTLKRARNNLVYEELFQFQRTLLQKLQENKQGKEGGRYPIGFEGSSLMPRLRGQLPFRLSPSQLDVAKELEADMQSNLAMQRLLQGDVGSGKTLVALLVMLLAYENGHQSALMAPTEPLAQQHFSTFRKWLGPLKVYPELLTGSTPEQEKQRITQRLRTKTAMVLVGTHALIQDTVAFSSLKLAVIDEQHKFGVQQRRQLELKGRAVDLLAMSATPIPRSLSMTLYGDLDLTTLLPFASEGEGRTTQCLPQIERKNAYDKLLERMSKGEQAYIVFPLIHENPNKTEKQSLLKSASELQKTFLKSVSVSVLHGQLDPKERQEQLDRFRANQASVLLSTTVIEVGIHQPNATVLIVENAEQFGLSQLHQLRGRIGRDGRQGHCFLVMGASASESAAKRLTDFCDLNDGFRLAELDLQLRGPGEFLGNKQAGIPTFLLADLKRDARLLQKARQDAKAFLSKAPHTPHKLL